MLNIVILYNFNLWSKKEIPNNMKPIVKQLKKYGKIHNYFLPFHNTENKFSLNDITLKNVAEDLNNNYKKLKNKVIITLSHSTPYGLFYVNKFPENIKKIICYPLRFYSQESYERRIWKLKKNKGWKEWIKNKKYHDIDKYVFNITKSRFDKLFDNITNDELTIIYNIIDIYLQKNHNKIPKKFKTDTLLFTQLDLDMEGIIKYNYDRKDLAKMKKILTKDDALFNSMVWNMDRVKLDNLLLKKNKENLRIKYIISGLNNFQDIIDEVKLI